MFTTTELVRQARIYERQYQGVPLSLRVPSGHRDTAENIEDRIPHLRPMVYNGSLDSPKKWGGDFVLNCSFFAVKAEELNLMMEEDFLLLDGWARKGLVYLVKIFRLFRFLTGLISIRITELI